MTGKRQHGVVIGATAGISIGLLKTPTFDLAQRRSGSKIIFYAKPGFIIIIMIATNEAGGRNRRMKGEIGMKRQPLLFAAATVLAIGTVAGIEIVTSSGELCAAAAKMSYSEDVVPILKGRCVSCHQPNGEGFEKSGFDLTTHAGLMKGTKFGPMVIPGDPESSNLMVLLDWRADPKLRMPHGKKKLSTCDRDVLRTWIREGAKNN